MKTIYKYEVPIVLGEDIKLTLPKGAKLLRIDWQDSTQKACLWALIDTKEKQKNAIVFQIYGTGCELPEDSGNFLSYFTTFQTSNNLVWHVFLRTDTLHFSTGSLGELLL